MFWIMLVAMGMVFFGTVFITDLWARQHPWWAIGFWAVCGWLTLAVILLAAMDILIIRASHRAMKRALEKEIVEKAKREREREQ